MSTGVRRALGVAGVVIVLVLLFVFARGVRWPIVLVAMRGADRFLLATALVCNLVSLTLKGVRWWVFLRPLGVRSLALVLRATYAGASLNNLVVAQGGEGARVVLVSRATGVSSARILSALALERILDAVSYLALLVAAAWLLPVPASIGRWRAVGSAVLATALGALLMLALVARRAPAVAAVASAYRAPTYLWRFVGAFTQIGSPSRVAAALALSFGAWALQVATYHLVALAVHLPLPLAGSVTAMLSVGISFLVRATPGNVGVFQAVYALTVRPFGIAEDAAVATALLVQVVQVVPTLVLGTMAMWWLGRGAARPGSRQLG